MDLREFVDKTRELGELKEIEGASWDLEIGTITHLSAKKATPPALLFDNIPGHKPGYRVLASPCLTDRRINLAFGLPLESERLEMVGNIRRRLEEPFTLVPPQEVREGPILENVYRGDDVDLWKFPAPKWQPGDGGRYIGTGTTTIVRDPDEGWVNLGTHRIEVHDSRTATIYVEPGKHVDFIRKKYWSRGQSCPVAVTLGGDPFHVAIGGNRVQWGVSEYDYIGWWNKEPVKVIRGPLTGLPIPADAEIAFEGEMVPPEVESRMEGPFSEWTGHYTAAKQESAFKVDCVLHRNNPIILGQLPFVGPGVVPGWMHLVGAARLWNHLDKIVPGVKGVWSHLEFGGFQGIAISIEQKYGGHAKHAALAALGEFPYLRKIIIVVDEDVDPSNLSEVLFAVGMRSNPDAWDVIRNSWGTNLDPLLSQQQRELGDNTRSAVLITACKPYHWMKDFPPSVTTSPEMETRVKEKWADF